MSEFKDYTGPRISVDNMAGQYFDFIGSETDTIQEFYERLPFEEKKPIEECNVHYSALGCIYESGILGGVFFPDHGRGKIKDFDPQAPTDTDIIIFLGSSLHSGRNPAVTLGHEFVHYATQHQEYDPYPVSKDKYVYEMELKLLTSSKIRLAAFAGKSAIYGSLYYGLLEVSQLAGLDSKPSLPIAAGFGLAAATFTSFLNRKKRSERVGKRTDEIASKLINYYNSSPWERDALELADMPQRGLAVKAKTELPKVLFREYGKKNRTVDYIHKKASLGKLIFKPEI